MVKINSKQLVKKTKSKINLIKQKKNGKTEKSKKDMSVDNFLSEDVENSFSDSASELSEDEILNKREDSDEDNDDMGSIEEEESNDEGEDEAQKHKKDLKKLKESDPEFYEFLQQNDKKLLQFNLSDEDLDDDNEENDKTAKKKQQNVHIPEENLEVASDESDFETKKRKLKETAIILLNGGKCISNHSVEFNNTWLDILKDEDENEEGHKLKDNRVITLKMLKKWQSDINVDKSNKTIIMLGEAFHAALARVADNEQDEVQNFKVEGSSVFNGVIQLCVLEMGPAIRRFLGLKPGSKQPPHKCKKFIKIKRVLKSYFTDLLKLLLGVSSSNIQTVLLKHLHYMSTFLVSFPVVSKSLVKRLINIWGTANDTVRVLAFYCILRITCTQQSSILDTVLKSMYMTYVKNSKFVSRNGLAAINFMRRSLVEIFALDTNVSYQHVFLYIRQLAIHLRNAVTVKKQENIQAVYNWQYVNSLKLWGDLLTATNDKAQMQQLVYPFVQVCLGTIKLVPTVQYYPLRFHVLQILMDMGRDTGVFIPILPFLLEILTSFDFNKKHQKVSMKPIYFNCLLRMSKSQLQENGFKDSIIETIYGLLLEYLTAQSHSIAFPDLSLICTLHIKQFLKACKNPNYTKKMKQLLEKIEQNSQFVENERAKVTFNISDFKQLGGWETQLKNKGTPLTKYFESWNKLRTIKKNKQLTNNEELADYKLPTIKRVKKSETKVSGGPVELFPSDSEDEDTESKIEKPRRGKRGGKNVNKRIVDASGPVEDKGEKDIVEDIEIDDW